MKIIQSQYNGGESLRATYLKQRRDDQKEGRIKDYNFSGDQIKPKLAHKYTKLNKLFGSLQFKEQDTIIWMPGYKGLTDAFKKRVSHLVNSEVFDKFILICVILNTVSLGLENMGDEAMDAQRAQANYVFTYTFIVEMILKLYVMGFVNYARDPICAFDGIIVLTSMIELFKLDD